MTPQTPAAALRELIDAAWAMLDDDGTRRPQEIEGTRCDECGGRVGPGGCCATMRYYLDGRNALRTAIGKAEAVLDQE